MKILLLGKNGQIGWELQRTLAPLGEVIALGRQELDLLDQGAIRKTIRSRRPSIVVNAAAYTAVDKAEEEPDLAMAVNGIAPAILAEECSLLGAFLLHYSTDYVFDGSKSKAYTEEDRPNPLNIYGKSKLAGEQAVAEKEAAHLLIRTGWVYSQYGKNFLNTILRLAAEKKELTIVNDQYGAPTWSRMIAEATALLLAKSTGNLAQTRDIYHLSAAGKTSWFGFAKKILSLAADHDLQAAKVVPISSLEYKTRAARPANTVLDNTKINDNYGLFLPSWQDSLNLVYEQSTGW